MFRYFFILVLSFNILSSNENVVKTSELELFLFKIGFESLLKDVDINKDKTKLNENEIKTINEKIELIMSELYKDKRVLLNDSNDNTNTQNISNKELNSLKKEIAFLKEEILKIKEKKIASKIEPKKIKNNIKSNQMRVVVNIANIYDESFSKANIVEKLKRDDLVSIESCDNFGWCKLKNKNYFIKKFLLKPYDK